MKIKSREDFGILLKSLNLNGMGIEIGVDSGRFSQTIINNFGLKKVYLLDAWKEFDKSEYLDPTNVNQNLQNRKYHHVLRNTKMYGESVEVVRGDGREEFKRFANESFDFIYIDSNHKYEAVKTDIENWFPKLKRGGVFAGHDYLIDVSNNRIIEVKKAVDEFCLKNNLGVSVTEESYPSWWFIK